MIDSLESVAAVTGLPLVHKQGDVPCVAAPGGREVVHEIDGFDFWQHGRPVAFDMTREEAVQWLTS